MIDMKTDNSPTLAVGVVDVAFGEMENVEDAFVYFENPSLSDFVFSASTSIAANVVSVTVMKLDVTAAAAAAWAVADTIDLDGFDLVVVADGI